MYAAPWDGRMGWVCDKMDTSGSGEVQSTLTVFMMLKSLMHSLMLCNRRRFCLIQLFAKLVAAWPPVRESLLHIILKKHPLHGNTNVIHVWNLFAVSFNRALCVVNTSQGLFPIIRYYKEEKYGRCIARAPKTPSAAVSRHKARKYVYFADPDKMRSFAESNDMRTLQSPIICELCRAR